ncbi:MAG: hypothetical protein H0Z40_09230 [Desulfotomaculum sp.]|nr:hypothetical protein [Desulfotomaculum sp.]
MLVDVPVTGSSGIKKLPHEVKLLYDKCLEQYYQSLLNVALLEKQVKNNEELREIYHEEKKKHQQSFNTIKEICEKYQLDRQLIIQLLNDEVRMHLWCR